MSTRLRRRIASVAIGAVLGVVAAAPRAAIVDSGTISIPIPPDFSGIYMNWVAGTSGQSGAVVPGWDFCAYASAAPGTPTLTFFTSASSVNVNQIVGSGDTVAALGTGTVVGPASILATAGIVRTAGTAFRTTATSYVGVAFENEATATTLYGYAEIQTTATLGFPATITRIVYDNTGAALVIGGAQPPVFLGASSRKTHGVAGTFDVLLSPIMASTSVEPRQGPNHTLAFQFNTAIVSATATVTEGTATVGATTFAGLVNVDLTGVADQQYVTVTLTNITDSLGGTGGTATARVGLLAGDVNQNRVVTLADVGQVNGQLAQAVTGSNYLKDINASGTLTLTDKAITNAAQTHSLPAP